MITFVTPENRNRVSLTLIDAIMSNIIEAGISDIYEDLFITVLQDKRSKQLVCLSYVRNFPVLVTNKNKPLMSLYIQIFLHEVNLE